MGEALWDALIEAGEPFAIKPFGVEAQRIMRLEKGHIIIGQDTDGLTQPYEADMGWAIGKKKAFYVGKRAVEIQNAGARCESSSASPFVTITPLARRSATWSSEAATSSAG